MTHHNASEGLSKGQFHQIKWAACLFMASVVRTVSFTLSSPVCFLFSTDGMSSFLFIHQKSSVNLGDRRVSSFNDLSTIFKRLQ